MTRCMDQWRQLVAAREPAEQRQRAQALAECARKNKVIYTLSLTDRASGAELPVADLAQHQGPVSVRLTTEIDGKREELRFDAHDADSVYPLLAE
jgi:hypothetical protein